MRTEPVYEEAHAVTNIYVFKNIKLSSFWSDIKGSCNNLRGFRSYLQRKILR